MIKENNKSPNLIQNYKNSIINNNINNININNYSRIKDDILLPNNKFLSEEITKKMLTPQLYTSLKIGNENNTEQNIQNQKLILKPRKENTEIKIMKEEGIGISCGEDKSESELEEEPYWDEEHPYYEDYDSE